jgi:gliding motility-associated-like protein
MKAFYLPTVFFLFSLSSIVSQVDLRGFTNQEIVNSEMSLHHFMEDYNLIQTILSKKPTFVVSNLDEQIYIELIQNGLPHKATVLGQLVREEIMVSNLTDTYNDAIDNQLLSPSFEGVFNSYKQSYLLGSQEGWRYSSRTAGQACVNVDFETGDWTGWETNMGASCTGGIPDCYTGGAPGSNTGDPNNLRRHLVVGAGADPDVPALSTLSPFGGVSSLRLGNEAAGYGAEKISHTFLVIAGQEIFTYAFAVVLQDPGTSHAIDHKPFFGIAMFDSNGNALSDTCAQYNVTAGTGKPGFQTLGTIEWKDWAQISLDLTAYVGQNVTIEFTTSDCDFGGHWGRAYIDATCSQPEISVVPDCEGILLQAPGGYFQYEWRDVSTGTVISNLQNLLTPGPGTYSVDLISENGCSITIDTVMSTVYVGLSHNSIVTNLSCFNDASGEIDVNAIGGVGPYSYSIDNGVTFVNTDVFSGLSAGNYNIIVNDAYGCRDSSFNYTITEPDLLGVDITTGDATCFGACNGTVVAVPYGGKTIQGNYLYSWDLAPDIISNSMSGLCAGLHTLTITDSNGCSLDTSFVINEPLPVVLNNVTLVNEDCYNSCTGEINITEPTAILFSIDGGVTYQPTGNYTNLCATASPYYLAVQNTAGCITRDTIVLTQPTPTNIVTSNDTLICYGTTATLTATMNGGTPGYTYTWYDGITQVFVGSPFLASPTTLTTYTVIGTDVNGCQVLESVVVNVLDPLQVIAYSDTTICESDSAQMYAIATGGNGNYTYTWDNGGGIGQYTTIFPIITTNYMVTVSDGCTNPDAQDQVLITVNPLPNISFSVDTNEGCVPTQIQFTNNTAPSEVASCFWDFGDGGVSNTCGQITHVYSDTGLYDVSLTVTSPQGCVANSYDTGMIWIHPNPVADFEADPFVTDVFATDITFTNTSVMNDFNSWTYGDFASSTGVDTTIIFPKDEGGTYDVCLEVETIYGCKNTICKPVIIEDKSYLFVPNTFTPDGDGKNDLFFPYVVGIDKDEFTFYVFNRWGDLIFQTDRYGNHWDGTYKGNMSQQDAYIWRVEARSLETGNMIEEMGHVVLLR